MLDHYDTITMKVFISFVLLIFPHMKKTKTYIISNCCETKHKHWRQYAAFITKAISDLCSVLFDSQLMNIKGKVMITSQVVRIILKS